MIIDDFSTGPFSIVNSQGPVLDYQQISSNPRIPVRCVSLLAFIPANSRQNVTLDIGAGQGLGLGSGPRVQHRLELIYGWSINHTAAPLRIDLRKFKGFRLGFGQNSQPLNVNVLFWHDNGVADSIGQDAPPNMGSFVLDFPFTAFSRNVPADRVPTANFLSVVTQGTHPSGGYDFILTKFSLY